MNFIYVITEGGKDLNSQVHSCSRQYQSKNAAFIYMEKLEAASYYEMSFAQHVEKGTFSYTCSTKRPIMIEGSAQHITTKHFKSFFAPVCTSPSFFLYLLKKIWWWDWNRLCSIYKQINVGDAELCVYSVEFEKDSLTIICSCYWLRRLSLIFLIIKTTSSIISQTDITAACAPTERNQLHSSYISYYMYI